MSVEQESRLEVIKGRALQVFVLGAAAAGACFGLKYGYELGELISPELDGAGEVVEHGIEVVTAVGASALSGTVTGVIGLWVADGGLVDLMEGN